MAFPWLKIAGRGASSASEITARLVQPPSLFMRVAAILLALYLIYHAWDFFNPPKPLPDPALRDVASRVIPQIVQDLRDKTPRTAALLHLEGDNSDYLTTQLRLAIESHNVLDLLDSTLPEKIRDMLRMRQPSYGTPDSAIERGSSLGASGVLFGTVQHFDSDDTGDARIDLDISLADVASKRVVFTHHYSEHIGGGILAAANLGGNVRGLGWFNRLVAWAVIAILLPVFTITFIRAMVRRESNRANAFTLGIYTVVDAFLAYLLLGIDLHSFMYALAFIFFVLVALVYNIFIMTFALRLEN